MEQPLLLPGNAEATAGLGQRDSSDTWGHGCHPVRLRSRAWGLALPRRTLQERSFPHGSSGRLGCSLDVEGALWSKEMGSDRRMVGRRLGKEESWSCGRN